MVRWPGFWPHEFNLTEDAQATHKLFASSLPLTFFPLDVVRGAKLWERFVRIVEEPRRD